MPNEPKREREKRSHEKGKERKEKSHQKSNIITIVWDRGEGLGTREEPQKKPRHT